MRVGARPCCNSGFEMSNNGVDNTGKSFGDLASSGSPDVAKAMNNLADAVNKNTAANKKPDPKPTTKGDVAAFIGAVSLMTVGSLAAADGFDMSFAPTDLFSF